MRPLAEIEKDMEMNLDLRVVYRFIADDLLDHIAALQSRIKTLEAEKHYLEEPRNDE